MHGEKQRYQDFVDEVSEKEAEEVTIWDPEAFLTVVLVPIPTQH